MQIEFQINLNKIIVLEKKLQFDFDNFKIQLNSVHMSYN